MKIIANNANPTGLETDLLQYSFVGLDQKSTLGYQIKAFGVLVEKKVSKLAKTIIELIKASINKNYIPKIINDYDQTNKIDLIEAFTFDPTARLDSLYKKF